MTPRCTNRVAWVGLDMSSRCRRPDGHPAEHRDHQWAWDDNGSRVDGTDHRRHASGVIDHPSRLTVEQVAEIRASQQAGQRTIDIARRMLLPYTTVYSVVTGQTYRTGDRQAAAL